MRKRILVWLMVLSMLLPTVCVNAAELLDTEGSLQQEDGDSTQRESKTPDTEEKTLPEGEATPSSEPEEKATPILGQTEEPGKTVEPTALPTETPEREEPVPTETPEATSTPTETPEPEEVTPTPVKTPVVTSMLTAMATPDPTSTATATLTTEVKKWTYKLSHAGIIQENKYPDDDFVRADELEEQVDLEGVRSFIVKSLLAGEEEIDISEYQVPVFYIDQVMSEVLNENPRFFYVVFDDCVVEDTIVKSVIPIYKGNRDEIIQGSTEYEQAVAKALACVDGSMNTMEKACVLHDYLVTHCEYDKSYQRYDAYSALVDGSAVCQGYTLAYLELMQRAGIDCTTVPSNAMNHIWNMILVDGNWYHVDTTWDDPSNWDSKSYCGHKNFLASDAEIRDNQEHHDWDVRYEANSTKFDNAEWKESNSIICKYQGTWYYMGSIGGANGLIGRTGSLENGTSSIVQSLTKRWPVWNQAGYYWKGSFGYITIYDNAIYFNGSDSIYKYKNGQIKELYTYTGGEGYLYDIVTKNDKLYCGVSQSYDGSISYIEVSDPEVEVKPTVKPTATPTVKPTAKPTATPTVAPTVKPTAKPTVEPTAQPTVIPTATPRRPVSSDFPFYDVDVVPGNWKYESVKYVYENGIMNGITNTDGTIDSFQPDEPLTRAMFATVLYRMAGQPPVAFENRFSDVSTGRYYSSAITWAYRNGIVNGYVDGSYGVDDYITREQIAKMLRIYAQVRGYSTSERADINSFPDVSDVSGWAVEHMSWAVGCGMINGKNVGGIYYLDAKGNATRVECAAMLMRFINRYGK